MKSIVVFWSFLALTEAYCIRNVFKCDDEENIAARFDAKIYFLNRNPPTSSKIGIVINKEKKTNEFMGRLEDIDDVANKLSDLGLTRRQLRQPFRFRLTDGAGVTESVITSANAKNFGWLFSEMRQLIDFKFSEGFSWTPKTPMPISMIKYMRNEVGKRYSVPGVYTVVGGEDNNNVITENIECMRVKCESNGHNYRIQSVFWLDNELRLLNRFKTQMFVEKANAGSVEIQRFEMRFVRFVPFFKIHRRSFGNKRKYYRNMFRDYA